MIEEPKTRSGFHAYRKAAPELRYGQAFCNYFGLFGEKWAWLFYLESDAALICKLYMNDWHTPE